MQDEVCISKQEYDSLKAAELFQSFALDLIHDMPIGIESLFEGDDRFYEWVRMSDPVWYADIQERQMENLD